MGCILGVCCYIILIVFLRQFNFNRINKQPTDAKTLLKQTNLVIETFLRNMLNKIKERFNQSKKSSGNNQNNTKLPPLSLK